MPVLVRASKHLASQLGLGAYLKDNLSVVNRILFIADFKVTLATDTGYVFLYL